MHTTRYYSDNLPLGYNNDDLPWMGNDFRDRQRVAWDNKGPIVPVDEDNIRAAGAYLASDALAQNPTSSWRDQDGAPAIQPSMSHARMLNLFSPTRTGTPKQDQTMAMPFSTAMGIGVDVQPDLNNRFDARRSAGFVSHLERQSQYQRQRAPPEVALSDTDEMRTGLFNKPYNPLHADYAEFKNGDPLGFWHTVRAQSANIDKRLRYVDGEVPETRLGRSGDVIDTGILARQQRARAGQTQNQDSPAPPQFLPGFHPVYHVDKKTAAEQEQLFDGKKVDARFGEMFRYYDSQTTPIGQQQIDSDIKALEARQTLDDAKKRLYQALVKELAGDRPNQSMASHKTQERLAAIDKLLHSMNLVPLSTRPTGNDIRAYADKLSGEIVSQIIKNMAMQNQELHQLQNTSTDMLLLDARLRQILPAPNLKIFEDRLRQVVSSMALLSDKFATTKSAPILDKGVGQASKATTTATIQGRSERMDRPTGRVDILRDYGRIDNLDVLEMHKTDERKTDAGSAPDLPAIGDTIDPRLTEGDRPEAFKDHIGRSAQFGGAVSTRTSQAGEAQKKYG